jgi:hypothetical protein
MSEVVLAFPPMLRARSPAKPGLAIPAVRPAAGCRPDVVVQALGAPAKHLIGSEHVFSDTTNLLVSAMATAGISG